jgi:hypothetical protein
VIEAGGLPWFIQVRGGPPRERVLSLAGLLARSMFPYLTDHARTAPAFLMELQTAALNEALCQEESVLGPCQGLTVF